MVRQDYTERVDGTATGQTRIGPVNLHRFGGAVYAKMVTARQDQVLTQSDTAFNVNLDGNAIFSTSQTFATSQTYETFFPDQNRYASGANVGLEVDIAVTGASTVTTGVLLETAEE